jgi:large subunit ribosomal protein L18e
MLRTIVKESPELRHTLVELRRAAKAHKAPVWAAVAEKLARPRHQQSPLNVGQLERLATDTALAFVVPGKLLAEGRLTKKLTVAAFQYSEVARTKVHSAGGSAVTILELVKTHPDGAGVHILA